jgi:hypothetical protein
MKTKGNPDITGQTIMAEYKDFGSWYLRLSNDTVIKASIAYDEDIRVRQGPVSNFKGEDYVAVGLGIIDDTERKRREELAEGHRHNLRMERLAEQYRDIVASAVKNPDLAKMLKDLK